MKIYTEKSYKISSEREMSPEQVSGLVALLAQRSKAQTPSSLEGRTGLVFAELPGLGKLAIKSYRRGGLLRYLNSSLYFGVKNSRAKGEFELIRKAAEAGVQVPEVIAYASRGSLFYRAWLVMREIPGHKTLAALAREDDSRIEEVLVGASENVQRLIEARVFHVDLHPGNVLVDSSANTYLIDFDKASMFSGRLNELRDRYIRRWRRAVIKHKLPELLSERFCSLVRKNFDGDL